MKYADWNLLPTATEELCSKLASGIIESSILMHRGITTREEADHFIRPTVEDLNDPYLLNNMDKCVTRISTALSNKERIGVFGDFDTDGLTGTAVLTKGLENLGGFVFPYVPHRVKEGHGISDQAIDFFEKRGVTLIITVDCGTTSITEITQASKMGIDTIVTDHHVPTESLPPAVAIVNPSLPDSEYPFPQITGVGTAIKVMEALYFSLNMEIPNFLYAFCALGTVSDVGLMKGENRYLTQRGIQAIKSENIPGIDALIRVSGLTKNRLSSEDLSFGIIPRINVAGRLQHAELSLDLLLTENESQAASIAEKLNELNKTRQLLTEKAMRQARQQVAKSVRENGNTLPGMIFVGQKSWSPGILGLIASRLVEEFYRPTVAVSGSEEIYRASARSVPHFNMIEAFKKCDDVFEKYGGHSMAAGFTIKGDKLREFRESLSALTERDVTQKSQGSILDIEQEISPSWINQESLSFLTSLEPFGQGNPTPTFLSKGMSIMSAKTVGKDQAHLKLTLEKNDYVYDAIAFRQGQSLGEARGTVDVAYTAGTNYWNGKESIQLTIQDFKRSG